MIWQFPFVLIIVFAYILQPFLMTKIAQRPSRARNLIWQYFFSALFATTIALFVGTKFGNIQSLQVMIIGVFNAFACYCYWRAITTGLNKGSLFNPTSLSKASLFSQADDLIAMALGYVILTEGKFLNPLLGLGIVLCIGSVFIFLYNSSRVQKDRKQSTIFAWIAAYSVIWGISMFLMRYLYIVKGMHMMNFVVSWYQGSLVGAFCVFMFSKKKEKGESLSWKQALSIAPLSMVLVTSLMLVYWIRMLAPIIVSQPILQVAEMVFPTLIGLWIFKEIKVLNNVARIAMAIGIIGGLIIVFSF